MMADLVLIACNAMEATGVCRKGALCYVLNPNPGSGGESIELLMRSRSGRWVRKWDRSYRYHNFRAKTVPDASPAYSLASEPPIDLGCEGTVEKWIEILNARTNRERAERLTK